MFAYVWPAFVPRVAVDLVRSRRARLPPRLHRRGAQHVGDAFVVIAEVAQAEFHRIDAAAAAISSICDSAGEATPLRVRRTQVPGPSGFGFIIHGMAAIALRFAKMYGTSVPAAGESVFVRLESPFAATPAWDSTVRQSTASVRST